MWPRQVLVEEFAAALPLDARGAIVNLVDQRRVPESVARAMFYLARAAAVTGQTIAIVP